MGDSFGTGSGCWVTVVPGAVLQVSGLLAGAEPSLVVTVMSPIWGKVAVLVELGLVEQRFAAVMEVINDGQPVTDVARRCGCLLYTSPSPRDQRGSRMPSSA